MPHIAGPHQNICLHQHVPPVKLTTLNQFSSRNCVDLARNW